MTYEAFEEHAFSGAPVELYHFNIDGGEDYFLTSSDSIIDFNGQLFTPQAGLSRSSIKQSKQGKANELGLTLPHNHTIATYFKNSLPHEEMTLTIYRKHRGDTQFTFAWKGHVVTCTFNYPKARLACTSLDGQREAPVLGATFQSRCNWKIYDNNCTLAFDVWAKTKTVTAISSDGMTLTVDDLSAWGVDYFKGGVVRFGTQAHVMVKDHTAVGGDTIQLLRAITDLDIGEQIKIAPACMGASATCDSRFSNKENYLGFQVPVKNIFTGDGLKGD